jgi:hypothetical protein
LIKEALLISIYSALVLRPSYFTEKMGLEQNGMKNAIPVRNIGTGRSWRNGEQPVTRELNQTREVLIKNCKLAKGVKAKRHKTLGM